MSSTLPDGRAMSLRCSTPCGLAGVALIGGSLLLWSWERHHASDLWSFVRGWIVDREKDGVLGRVWWILSDLGHGYMLTVLIAMLTVLYGSRRFLQDALFVTIGASLATNLLKVIVDRARPAGDDPHSWPSGHATASLALAMCFVTKPRHFAIALPIAVAAGLARVMRERHWPSDVLGGFGVACIVAALLMPLPAILPKLLVAPRTRIALGCGIFAFALCELAFSSYRHGLSGYLQLIVQPMVLVTAISAFRLAEPARP